MSEKKAELMPDIGEGLRNVLTQQTPPDAIRRYKGKGGKTFSYVPHAWVTNQLNTAFNWGWSWEIVEWQIIPDLPNATEVFILGRLTVHIPNGDIVKAQFGTQDVKRDRKGNILSLGDDLKAASSDGLKKAASLLGLALDLYSSDAPPDSDTESTLSDDPMTAYWAATKAKGLTQAEGAALLQKHKGNPDRALKELAKAESNTDPPAPKANGNGTNGKRAAVGTSKWSGAGKELAETVPYFMGKNGPNYHHMLGAAAKLGFESVTDSNLDDVIAALKAHANQAANEEVA